MPDIRDELGLFLLCSAFAYEEVLAETGQFPPDSETVRKLAYKIYEEELAKSKNSC